MNLTPNQLHYLKRELITIQLHEELNRLRKNHQLADLLDKDHPSTDLPFLRYIFQHFVLEFPLLEKNNEKQFWDKVQTFLDDFCALKLDTYAPKHKGATQRRVLLYKLEQMLTIALSATIKTVQGQEESIHVLPQDIHNDDTELANAISKDLSLLENDDTYLEWIGTNDLFINVVTVREVSERRTIREHQHAEFVVQTLFADTEKSPAYVARRHGHFRQLEDDLKKAFPTLDIPSVPSKVRDVASGNGKSNQHLYREKDRILLRSFLRQIATDSKLAKSTVFQDFLTRDTFQLSAEEKADSEKRWEMDQKRAAEEKRFREEVDRKVMELNDLLDMLKKRVMQKGGLIEIFDIIKKTEQIQDLPAPLLKAFEWGRINFAFVLHTQFVTSDRSAENIASLKRTHSLMPYRAVAQILKFSNPFSMVKGVLDLFLAQPFGGRSLFQRIILANMHDEAKELQKNIEELEKSINDEPLCQKLRNAVDTEAPPYNQRNGPVHKRPITETLDVLRNEDIAPVLSADQIMKVAFANDARQTESRLLVKKLYQLWLLYARKREQEIMMTLVFQGVTGELLKEIFAIFYQPLAQVYKAANIGDSIQHLAAFIEDLIKLLDSLDADDVTNTAQPFIELVQRHEQRFYFFVHNVHAQDKSHLFDELLGYVDNMFAFLSNGISGKLDLDQTIKDAGIDDQQQETLLQELEAVCDYHRRRKEQHLRRRREKLMVQDTTVESRQQANEAFNFLPNHAEVMTMIDDMDELNYDSDSSSDEDDIDETNSPTAHEMTLQAPELVVLPRIVPAFVQNVTKLMAASGI
ncbi:uncharacterized protein BYT42DRAFT_559997 [Radiomyces spectabilis]|uniref:uncharacterized protein n=1 Tax=Radiomyces spectabilis TaxID=64574 RepID=UPI00221F4757|nr:uncharacterized protein BYT42DRAFT_559997 [Radiomyces spectabilis]KAI8388420.1 hypothetical protein BYT42DRAFT_559997 [Radiomyces spectabilis]